jgi:NADH-quinone oxidoreductase subunit M
MYLSADSLSLTFLLLLPLIGIVLIALTPKDLAHWVRKTAIVCSTITLLYASNFYVAFEFNASRQFQENYPWSENLGNAFHFALDGFSLPMVLLAALLSWVAILVSNRIHAKLYYQLLLMLETAMIGVFIAQDWSLFYVFWEATLIPLFFLIDGWGGKKRQKASLNFVLYTMGGSIFMLISLLVAFDLVGMHSFDFTVIKDGMKDLDESQQILIFLGLLIGFGVKMPIFPLHGWLSLAHVEAPSPVSILLSGILLKMGAYGIIRAVEMLPKAALALQTLLFVLAMISIVYGALLAWQQSDLKRMIAYSSVSHMGVVLLGISSLTEMSILGASLQMVAHGLSAGALFMLIGLLYERTHTRDINDYGSLIHITPKFAFFIIMVLVASVGFPGTIGFVSELHILVGSFPTWQWWMLLLGIGILVTAVYSLRTGKHLFTGPMKASMQHVEDLKPLEMLAASVLLVAILYFGFYPTPLIELMAANVKEFSEHISIYAHPQQHVNLITP